MSRLARPDEAERDDLALALTPEHLRALRRSRARAAVVPADADWRGLGLAAALLAPPSRLTLAVLTEAFAAGPTPAAQGVHPSAVIAVGAVLEAGAHVGPFVHVAEGARIGAGAVLAAHVTIAADAEIGANAVLGPGVRVGEGVRLGRAVRVGPNAVIGAEGFSFAGAAVDRRPTAQMPDAAAPGGGGLRRIHSLASVEVGDGVEIGACTAIDRGTVSDTRIGSGTKIDNLVQIGHNVRVGRDCLICGQAGIAGSAEIGDRVVLGGRAGVADHVRIGDESIIGGGTLVARDVAPGSIMLGVPAQPREEFLRQLRALRRLPRVVARLRRILADRGRAG